MYSFRSHITILIVSRFSKIEISILHPMKLLNLCSPEIGLVFRVFYYVGILGQIVEDSIQNNDMVRILEEG